MAKLIKILATTFVMLLVLSLLHQTEAKIKLKKLLKAGLVLGALGSRRLPRFLPIPLPIPIRMNQQHTFGGGHFGSDYYDAQGSGFVPAYGSGGYQFGSGGFGGGVYGGSGGGYTAQSGWW